jgi:hypothetical protein
MLRHLLGSGQRTMMFILVPRVVHLALARYVSSWLQSNVAHDDLYIVFHPVYSVNDRLPFRDRVRVS